MSTTLPTTLFVIVLIAYIMTDFLSNKNAELVLFCCRKDRTADKHVSHFSVHFMIVVLKYIPSAERLLGLWTYFLPSLCYETLIAVDFRFFKPEEKD